jgi:Leucine-rich repeat (LRR) protein
MFKDLSSLNCLEIDGAKGLKRITRDTFKSLVNIKTIILSKCDISEIDREALVCLPKLKTLNLKSNYLSECAFELPTHLENLILSKNKIESIDGVFCASSVSLRRLAKLKLRTNRIKSLPAGCFSGLASLKYLNLDDNFLNDVSEDAFDGLVNLRELDLGCARITKIGSGLYSPTPCLIKLSLKYSEIESIDEDAFSNLRNKLRVSIHKAKCNVLEPFALRDLITIAT